MLGQELETWTLTGPTNRAFSGPGVGSRGAADGQRTAFHRAIAGLGKTLGSNPRSWTWGRIHTRELTNLALITSLNYGPRAERGDGNTPLAAGGAISTSAPTWRMVVDWAPATFQGAYPVAQSA